MKKASTQLIQLTVITSRDSKTFKSAKVPLFGHDKENIAHWIFLIRSLMNANNHPSWDRLKQALKQNFQPEDIDKRAREELLNLRQFGDKFQEYVKKFNQLINQIPAILEEDKIMYFRHGIRRETDAKVIQHRPIPKTLVETIAIATAYEQTIHRGIKPLCNYNKGPIVQKNGPERIKNNSPLELVCYRCHKKGHTAKSCTTGKTGETFKQKNHHKVFMTYDTRVSLLVAPGLLCNQRVDYVLDTAATQSVVSSSFVRNHKLKLTDGSTKLLVAQSEPIVSDSLLTEANVVVYGYTC